MSQDADAEITLIYKRTAVRQYRRRLLLEVPLYTRWAKKVGPQTHGHYFVKYEPIFKKNHWKIPS